MEKFELLALDYASKMGGEFIEYVGKTDLATFTDIEWRELVKTIGVSFCDKRIELHTQIPF